MASLPKAMDAMERFNRRTISFSSRQDIMNEVAEILSQSAAIEEDEESAASGDSFEKEAAASDQGGSLTDYFGAKMDPINFGAIEIRYNVIQSGILLT